jgi:ribosomal protein L37AE/L43A
MGLAIYLIFFLAKRHEVTETGVPIGQTYACASCGRRGVRDHMVPREHDGAVSWYCAKCAGGH